MFGLIATFLRLPIRRAIQVALNGFWDTYMCLAQFTSAQPCSRKRSSMFRP
jgi:hypothetical protein